MKTELQLTAFRFRLGETTAYTLKQLAEELINEDVVTDDLIKIAYVCEDSLEEIGPHFEKVIRELKVDAPKDRSELVWSVLKYFIREIAERRIPPRKGLHGLIEMAYHGLSEQFSVTEYVGDSHGIQNLYGSFYSYDDLEERPTECSIGGFYGLEAFPKLDEHVIQECKKWLKKRSEQIASHNSGGCAPYV
ncbi:hypothetical protein MLD52_21950 [Puniceicoccaceae bacterium K14]|nr:hypothetical protein [Puniceicoccaceae bacterium K14]